MKILPYTRYSVEEVNQKAIEENWPGQGTPEKPYIIESTHSFSLESVIRNSSLHIIFKNCTFKYLTLNKCTTVKFVGCKFDALQLLKCSQSIVEDCLIKIRLELANSMNLIIQDCVIARLDINRSHENLIKNSKIDEANNICSSGNKFKDLEIQEKDLVYLLKNKAINKMFMMVVPALILMSISTTIRFWNLNFISSVLTLGFAAFTLSLISITSLLDYRKMKKYEPNELL